MFRGAAALAEAVDDCEVAATAEAIVEARRLRDRLDALIASAEVEFVRCGGHEVEGHATYGSFLRARCGVSTSESRRIAVRAKKLGRWPEVLDAWQAGEITGAKVEVMSAVVPDRHVERFSIATTEALVWLPWVTVDDTRRKVSEWVSAADDAVQSEAAEAGAEPVEDVPQRTMSASRIIDDRLEITGSFDTDVAAAIEDALRAATRPDGDGEKRSPLQRRADAMVEICRFYVAHHQQPPNTGRPDRGVIVADVAALFRAILRGDGVHTAAQLQTYLDAQPELGALERGLFCDAFDGAGGTARTLDGHTVTDTLLRHVTTNGILERLLRTGHRIIDHGRSVRVFTESQRRAMAARDAGSRISGESPWGVPRPPLTPLRPRRHHRHQHRLPQDPTRTPRPPPQRIHRPHRTRRLDHAHQLRRTRTLHPTTGVARPRPTTPRPHHHGAGTGHALPARRRPRHRRWHRHQTGARARSRRRRRPDDVGDAGRHRRQTATSHPHDACRPRFTRRSSEAPVPPRPPPSRPSARPPHRSRGRVHRSAAGNLTQRTESDPRRQLGDADARSRAEHASASRSADRDTALPRRAVLA
jgi:hypothetical protein